MEVSRALSAGGGEVIRLAHCWLIRSKLNVNDLVTLPFPVRSLSLTMSNHVLVCSSQNDIRKHTQPGSKQTTATAVKSSQFVLLPNFQKHRHKNSPSPTQEGK